MIVARPLGAILLGSPTPYQATRRYRNLLLKTLASDLPAYIKAIPTNNFYHLFASKERARRWLFTPSTPEEIVETCFRQLQDEPLHVLEGLTKLPSPETTLITSPLPCCFIGGEEDTLLAPPAVIRASATAYGTVATFFPGGHDVMLDTHWEDVAMYMDGWMKKLLA